MAPTHPPRPFFKSSVKDLEALVVASKGDEDRLAQLLAIAEELRFRSSRSAVRLANRVGHIIEIVKDAGVVTPPALPSDNAPGVDKGSAKTEGDGVLKGHEVPGKSWTSGARAQEKSGSTSSPDSTKESESMATKRTSRESGVGQSRAGQGQFGHGDSRSMGKGEAGKKDSVTGSSGGNGLDTEIDILETVEDFYEGGECPMASESDTPEAPDWDEAPDQVHVRVKGKGRGRVDAERNAHTSKTDLFAGVRGGPGIPGSDSSVRDSAEPGIVLGGGASADVPNDGGSDIELDEDQVVRQKMSKVFSFLQALNELRVPVQRQVSESNWSLWLRDLPDCDEVVLGQWAHGDIEEDQEENDGTGNDFIVRIERPEITPAPEPSADIKKWISGSWEDPSASVSHLKSIEEKPFAGGRAWGAKEGEAEEPKHILFADDPRRISDWKAWTTERNAWARTEAPKRAAAKAFESLHTLYSLLQREGEQFEMLVGDGIMSWEVGAGGIHYPLITRPVDLEFSPELPSFTLRESAASSSFQLSVFRGVTEASDYSAVLGRAQDIVEQNDLSPLDGRMTTDLLRSLPAQLSARGRFIGEGRPPQGSDAQDPLVGRSPVVLVRKRVQGYARFIQKLLDSLPGAKELPPTLRGIVGDYSNPRDEASEVVEKPWEEPADLLLSMPANPDQIRAARALRKKAGVLVQGPPGTGKSHTIGNLVGDLLAQGKSVLVTSHTSRALKVLRDKVEKDLQPLCVSVLDNDAESRSMLDESIQQIANRLDSSDPDELRREASELDTKRTLLVEELSTTQRLLMDALGLEGQPVKVDGKEVSSIDAAKWVRKNREDHGWIPTGVVRGMGLPLSEDGFKELYASSEELSREDEKDFVAGYPNLDALPAPDAFEHSVARRMYIMMEGDETRFDHAWSAPTSSDKEASLDQILNDLAEARVMLDDDAAWATRLMAVSIGGGTDWRIWEQALEDFRASLAIVDAARPSTVRHQIELPRDMSLWSTIPEMLAHAENGGNFKTMSLLFRGEWKKALAVTRIDGRTPSTRDEFKALKDAVDAAAAVADLKSRWTRLWGVDDPVEPQYLESDAARVIQDWIPRVEVHLLWKENVWLALYEALGAHGLDWSELLEGATVGEPSGDYARDQLFKFRAAFSDLIVAVNARKEAAELARINEELAELAETLESGTSVSVANDALRTAVENLDPVSYRSAHTRIQELERKSPIWSRRRGHLSRLREVAPAWAEAIEFRADGQGGNRVPGPVAEAWQWSQISAELDFRGKVNIDRMQAEVATLRKQIRGVTTALIDRKAWAHQVERSAGAPRAALMGYRKILSKIGAGTGKRAPRLKEEARRMMSSCKQAVPVWIMPMARVVESFDPAETRFDVVIVDEASQSDVMGLLAFYLGHKVLVVGDEEQVSPDAVGQKTDQVQDLINTHLTGIPNAQLYDGNTSIYDLAGTSFGSAIRLTEHFRCVPEIISFSNYLSYGGTIRPLRESSGSNLYPHTVQHRVSDGARAAGGAKENVVEAIEITSLIAAASEFQEYEDKTMGVISLVGNDQALLIEKFLRKLLPLDAIERHRILCGSSSAFQGDERNVMFLSVVDSSPDEGMIRIVNAGARDMYKKRYNVAASRAQDQMWVVHSLNPDRDLQSGDLRLRLIQHAADPEAADRETERAHAKAESPFEKMVLEDLIRAGHRVEPQVQVGRFRLDIVVEGVDGRVVVECDGDRYHGIRELAKDMERQAILERLGWRFVRIRGSQYYRNPEATIQAMLERLDDLGIVPPKPEQCSTRVRDLGLYDRVCARAAELRVEWGDAGRMTSLVGHVTPTGGSRNSRWARK